LHLAHEEGLLHANTSVHAGMRCPLDGGAKHDLANDARCGFSIIRARSIDSPHVGIPGIIDAIRRRVGNTAVYISVDIDVLDPAFAPGTGTSEVGGWSTRELLSVLDGLVGLKVVGGDVVEVAPAYDNVGETTVLAASEVVHSLLTLMVKTPVQPLGKGRGEGRDEL